MIYALGGYPERDKVSLFMQIFQNFKILIFKNVGFAPEAGTVDDLLTSSTRTIPGRTAMAII